MFDGMMFVPWLLAVITAIWFGFAARHAERNSVLWSLGGGLFALVASTIVFGLGHAAAMPFSEQQRARLHLGWTVESVVLIGVLGWLLTLGLHRQGLRFVNPGKPNASPPPPANRPPAPGEAPKAPPPPPSRPG